MRGLKRVWASGVAALAVAAIAPVAGADVPEKPTFSKDVLPILQENCQTCHRADGMGPFALETYEQVHAKRTMIQYMVKQGLMPPWFAHQDVGEWANDRRLPERDLLTLLRWVDEGGPRGDVADAPPPRTWSTAWNIGEPDAVLRMPQPFAIPAEGVIDYQVFYVKTDFDEDKWPYTVLKQEPAAGAKVSPGATVDLVVNQGD